MTRIPLNRVVAFAGPYISAVAGGTASWLVAKVNIAGLPGLDQNNLQTAIAGALAWLLVTGLTWAGHSKWLTGHHIELDAEARVNAAGMAAAAATPPPSVPDAGGADTAGNGFHPESVATVMTPDVIEDPGTEAAVEVGLPSDTQEFASPPSPVAFQPLEPEMA
jgi:hypothetical protein